ncbi:extracellular solute-binding protein [Paenibacillus abyssi]|uniref:Sugar ABC transporter substrate-binding protein n=2 Tax=Paenibacillus abyssi TaxID=1340531 RepID=A0A917G7M7_9BACL|nr:extracellular solute-binding protein [Paenibacillus abyssi]GGG26037.1 sugar ABC transporter substrate-binding protein [Paenibacillus abyssi]
MGRPSRSEYTARIRRLVDRLRTDIRSGELRSGDYIPSEVELGSTYGLSKESVRKALDILVEEGMIVKIKRVGNRVAIPAYAQGKMVDAVQDTERRTILRFAYYPSMDTEVNMKEAIAEFESANPSIGIQLLPTPFPVDYVEHGIADVITLTNWDALKLREQDPSWSMLASAPHSEAAHPLLYTPFLGPAGRTAAAPFVFSPIVLCYNRQHFMSCQLEEPQQGWTWDRLLHTSRVLSGQLGVIGFAAHMQSVNRWPVFLLQNGFRLQNGEEGDAVDRPAFWESLRMARNLIYQQGGAAPFWSENDADAERWFREGRVSIIMTSYFGINRWRDTGIDYGISELPGLKSDSTLLLVTGLAISGKAKYPDASRALVRFLCSPKIQSGIRRSTLTLPAHLEALTIRDGLAGNRPQREPDLNGIWGKCKFYSDLQLGTKALESVREELKTYWSKLEDETEAGKRLDMLID